MIPQDAGDHLKVQVGMDEASALEISAFGCACRGGNLEDAGMVWNGRLTASLTTAAAHRKVRGR